MPRRTRGRDRRKRMTPCKRCGKRVYMSRMAAHWRKHMRDGRSGQ